MSIPIPPGWQPPTFPGSMKGPEPPATPTLSCVRCGCGKWYQRPAEASEPTRCYCCRRAADSKAKLTP